MLQLALKSDAIHDALIKVLFACAKQSKKAERYITIEYATEKLIFSAWTHAQEADTPFGIGSMQVKAVIPGTVIACDSSIRGFLGQVSSTEIERFLDLLPLHKNVTWQISGTLSTKFEHSISAENKHVRTFSSEHLKPRYRLPVFTWLQGITLDVRAISFAHEYADHDKKRPYIDRCGVWLECHKTHAKCSATDGHRLLAYDSGAEEPQHSILLDNDVCAVIDAILPGVSVPARLVTYTASGCTYHAIMGRYAKQEDISLEMTIFGSRDANIYTWRALLSVVSGEPAIQVSDRTARQMLNWLHGQRGHRGKDVVISVLVDSGVLTMSNDDGAFTTGTETQGAVVSVCFKQKDLYQVAKGLVFASGGYISVAPTMLLAKGQDQSVQMLMAIRNPPSSLQANSPLPAL